MPLKIRPDSVSHTRQVKRTLESGSSSDDPLTHYQLNWVNAVNTGTNVPGWREKLRLGMSATTTLTGLKVESRYTPGYGRFEMKKLGQPFRIYLVELLGNHKIYVGFPVDPNDISDSKANAEAMGRFLRQSRKVLTAFQGGIVLGELRQTLSLIRNPAKSLRQLTDEALHILRRIRRLGVKNRLSLDRVAKQLADNWLEVQFGWRPLFKDISDGCDALERLSPTGVISLKRLTASATIETDSTELMNHENENNLAPWFTRTTTLGSCMVIYRGAMRVEAKNPVLRNAELFGFSLNNFAPTVWELIPYSFLIDYFTNVGDIIEGWSQLGTRLAWCNRTVRRSRTVTSFSGSSSTYWKAKEVTDQELGSLSFSPAKSVTTTTRVSRAEFTGAMVPSLSFEVPSLGSLRWLNIAALVLSRDSDRTWFYD